MPFAQGDPIELVPGIAKEVQNPGPQTIVRDAPTHFWVPEDFEVLADEITMGTFTAPPDQPAGPPWTNGKLIYTAGIPGKVLDVLSGDRYLIRLYWPVMV